jgi:DNA-binding MarR family transcriptional regulator
VAAISDQVNDPTRFLYDLLLGPEIEMAERLSPNQAVALLREVIVELVRRDEPVLSSHQLGVYLTCYTQPGDHTVRGLAADLNVSKSVITRSLDKLGELDLVRRKIDQSDRRSVIVERTPAGFALMAEMGRVAINAAQAIPSDSASHGPAAASAEQAPTQRAG